MKEKALTHLQKLLKKPCVNQALALLMCAATLFGTMPTSALAAADEVAVISGVSAPEPSVYTVDMGTELSDVGLPAGLELTVTAGESEASTRTEPVEWVGDYDKDAAGEYTLTAAFTDETLVFSPMPAVRVIVSEAEPAQQDSIPVAHTLGEQQETPTVVGASGEQQETPTAADTLGEQQETPTARGRYSCWRTM